MLRSKKETQTSPRSNNGLDDGKIRVSAKKNRFSLFHKKPKEDPVIYNADTLKGRNPMEIKKRSARSPACFPLNGRNPVDFDKTNGYDKKTSRPAQTNPTTDPYGNPIGDPKSPIREEYEHPLAGRNPSDFGGCDPYDVAPLKSKRGNKKGGRDQGKQQGKERNVPCDPYGNPIQTNEKSSGLEGRNPQDFDGPRDPYGNPIETNNKNKRSSLAGRNPQDCDQAKNSAREPTNRRSSLAGRNPIDFDKVKNASGSSSKGKNKKGSVPNKQKRNSPAGRNPQDFDKADAPTVSTTDSTLPYAVDSSESDPGQRTGGVNSKRRSTFKAPQSTREKFSLKTHHTPRAGVPTPGSNAQE